MTVKIPGGDEHDEHYVPPQSIRWTQGPLGFLAFIGTAVLLVMLALS